MRTSLRQRLEAEQETRIDLSPLIDIVFILLIFFIVSTVFVREAGVEVDKPDALSTEALQGDVLIVAITAAGEVVYGGTNVGPRGVRAALRPALQARPQPVVVQADRRVTTDLLVRVLDEARLAGAQSVHVATRTGE